MAALCGVALLGACAHQSGVAAPTPAAAVSVLTPSGPLASARQLIVVTTASWDTTGGELRRYERDDINARWRAVGPTVPVVVGQVGAAFQRIVGGNISILTELCENSRDEAFELMLRHADDMGATAIVAVRYDATEVMAGVTEVLCYGTAVLVEAS